MILIDTSALIGSLTAERSAFPRFIQLLTQGEPILLCSLVLFEWQRGPRTALELEDQERLLPSHSAVDFGIEEAGIAARLYKSVAKPRGREMDLAIAACAIVREIPLWTLNRKDFTDIPGLKLV